MLLDMEIYFAHPGRVYYPGDIITCKIDVESSFKIKCKYIKVRLRCPYRKSDDEVFRVYEIANRRIGGDNDQWEYKIGEKAENIVLQRGRNQFVVTCKIPDVLHATFEEYSNVIRCSYKVTINANWLPKRYCLDWFILEPSTVAEKVFNKIENGAYRVFDSIGSRFRRLVTKKKLKT